MKEIHSYRCLTCSQVWEQLGSLGSFIKDPLYMKPTCCLIPEIKLFQIEFVQKLTTAQEALEFSKRVLTS